MIRTRQASRLKSRLGKSLLMLILMAGLNFPAPAHPLGNFTINHFTRLEIGGEQVNLRFVVDMAEISTLQELQGDDVDGDGIPSQSELETYLARTLSQYVANLRLVVDDARVPLQVVNQTITSHTGEGGLPLLRIECDLVGRFPALNGRAARRLRFEDVNHPDRIGWREAVVRPAAGISVFDTNAFGGALTDELKTYPQDLTIAPLNERAIELSFVEGAAPANSGALRTRDINRSASLPNQAAGTAKQKGDAGLPSAGGKPRDRFAELIAVPELTFTVALLGLLIAAVLGAAHAFSPGHGKTVVGAYLVGSRGTASHAAFLGLTVTVTHTLGVFALGLVTLFASQYIVPERLYPILSFISGAIVVAIGLSLFVKRLRVQLGYSPQTHSHTAHEHDSAHDHAPGHSHASDQSHTHDHVHAHDHGHVHRHAQSRSHEHAHDSIAHAHDNLIHDHDSIARAHDNLVHEHGDGVHSHDGGTPHSHLPPGTDGSRVTWRSLLALGISGGLLPCPSALVVLLSAITLGRTGFGLLLVVAFSIGLAATLTAIGLIFVYAGRMMKRTSVFNRFGHLARVVPTLSAFVIACVGIVLCYEALAQAGALASVSAGLTKLFAIAVPPTGSLSTFSVLVFGFGLGLKHAVEADHMAAVSTIVSERRSLLSSSLVGGLWGVGHTISLFVVGVIVILLRVRIGERTALGLEFGVALMLIALGVIALVKLSRSGESHTHHHHHGARAHAHAHLHDGSPEPDPHTHHSLRIGKRPLIIGMVHGLAGSAALMLLVLSTIPAPLVALVYIIVFGTGSIGGMMLMSTLVGLPLHLTANNFTRANFALRGVAGLFSLCFGLFMVYEIGYVGGLFR